jgi:hypothetical protein
MVKKDERPSAQSFNPADAIDVLAACDAAGIVARILAPDRNRAETGR